MNIVLFFTRGVSINEWVEKGLFDREIALYESIAEISKIEKICLLTYGSSDKVIFEELRSNRNLSEKIVIVEKPKFFKGKIGNLLYTLTMPFFQSKYIKSADILKTNQVDGSLPAIISSFLVNRNAKLIGRCGYLLSSLEEKMNSQRFFRNFVIRNLEKLLFSNADVCVFASQDDRSIAVSNYSIPLEKTKVLYNFIDERVFINRGYERSNSFVFVGRIESVKNLKNTILSLSKTNYQLDIYGAGSMLPELESFCKDKKYKVNFKGVVRNSALPNILNGYKYYIQCSHQEGMPKTLIEAISCGCIAIGTNVKGINEVIVDNKTGYLAQGTDSNSILEAISRINENKNVEISENLAEYVKSNYSLKNYVCREINEIYGIN
ncbi:TPA: glycosyltransferase family 4 protein [Vibrio vulnificus]|nr:glycosyltransferase family 4 protein [Vibrio vulnificus]HDY7712061.1 glycosyltransferase family 4 protein [Vibrio vulnificus]